MTKVHKTDFRKTLLAVLLIVAVALAFSPLTAMTAHAGTYDFATNKATAAPVAFSTTYDGTFVNNTDYHWYRFTLPAATPITIGFNLTAISGPTATQTFATFTVYQDDGSTSGLYRDSISVTASQTSGNYVTSLPAGTFYLRVAPSSYITAGSTNKYSFSLVDKGLLANASVPSEFFMSTNSKNALTYVKKNIRVTSEGYSALATSEYDVTMTNKTKAGPSTVTITGKNQHYGTLTVTIDKYLSKTYHRAQANFKKKSITIDIPKIYGSTGYIIKYKFPGKKWKTLKTSKTKYTFTKVQNLKIGKKFSFKIIAYAKVGKKTYYSRTYSSAAKAWDSITYTVKRSY
jgi:hypothetical protein